MAEPGTAIGIHICGKTLRRAELERSGAGVRVLRLECTRAGEPAAPQPLHATGPKTPTFAALPGMDVMTRCWELPAASDAKLRQILNHRLEAESPVPVDQLAWSFRAAASNGRATRLVLVQAARHSRVAQHTGLLAAAHCGPDLLTTEAEAMGALVRYGLEATGSGTALLVLAGTDEWLVGVLTAGLVRAIRHVRAGAGRVEAACREVCQLVEGETVSGELQRILWCETSPSVGSQLLSEWLHVRVEPLRAAPGLTMNGAAVRPEDLVTFGPAIGLALAGLHEDCELIGLWRPAAVRQEVGRLERLLARPWRLTAVAAGLLLLAAGIHVAAIRSETAQMEAAVRARQPVSPEMDAKVQAMRRLERYRIDVEAIMAELSRSIPPSVVVTSVQLSRERRLTIKGTSGDPKAISGWADALRKSERFKTVNPERAAPGQGGDFTISAELTGVEKLISVGMR